MRSSRSCPVWAAAHPGWHVPLVLSAAPICIRDNRGHQRPLLIPRSALPGSSEHAELLGAPSDLWEEAACKPNASCSSGFSRWMRRGFLGACAGVSNNEQVQLLVMDGVCRHSAHAAHTWLGAGRARTQEGTSEPF